MTQVGVIIYTVGTVYRYKSGVKRAPPTRNISLRRRQYGLFMRYVYTHRKRICRISGTAKRFSECFRTPMHYYANSSTILILNTPNPIGGTYSFIHQQYYLIIDFNYKYFLMKNKKKSVTIFLD